MDSRLFFPVIRISDSAAAPFAPEKRGRCKTVRPSLEGGREGRKVDERRAEKHKKQLMMSGEEKEEREGRLTGRRRKGGGGEHSGKKITALSLASLHRQKKILEPQTWASEEN